MGFSNPLEIRRRTPIEDQVRVLRKLLKRAGVTSFGRQYGFQDLWDVPDVISSFQSTVPYFDYDQIFARWWQQSLDGRPNVSWKGRTKYFALSSGTTGDSSKYIPVTNDMRRSMQRAALRMFACLPRYGLPTNFYFKDWLMIGGSANLQDLGPAMAGDLSGINARNPPLWLRKFYKPGTKTAKLSTWEERTAVIVENAPRWDVSVLTGVPSWVQLTIENILAHYNLDDIHQLWPNLSIFVSGGVALAPYKKSFEALLGKPLIYQDTYLASEGFIAFQDRPGTSAMRLITDNGIFFEFVPFDETHFNADGHIRPGVNSLSIDEVAEGEDYALVITTCAGAWRYLIGDVVRFADKARCEIIITGRTKHFLSICGEHLSIDNMNQAIGRLERDLEIVVGEFTVGAVRSGSHFTHRWYLGVEGDIDHQILRARLDEHLKEVNDDYRAERGAMLGPPQVQIIPARRFYDWQKAVGKMNGQSKIPRVLKGEQFKKWEQFVNP